ncbi:hypothetical protein FA13DRAFT_1705201 [Coprinellus micaceus]|uniref:Uncharacterized protein n=1 Tax=Coprinellus micaceus TaxID=71717 RepID=A0A4Y7TVP7_COPMI|nr:hypothetical protein FA13DRAFT_1705201 [Coprinellus micaceus]
MVPSSEGMCDLILGAVESREAFQRALSRCADPSEKGSGLMVKQRALSGGGEQGGSKGRHIDEEHSDPSPCDPAVLERLGHMLRELTRKPTDKDLVTLAKFQVRNEWYTKDGSTFWYRNMAQQVDSDFEVPSVDASFIVFAGELALRDLFHRRSLFDTTLLPQLEQVMNNQELPERGKIQQLVFLRHHSPVDSFVFHWELFKAEKSDDLLDVVLKDLNISSKYV